MVLGAWIEVILLPSNRRRDALVLATQRPPMAGVLGARCAAVEHAPSVPVNHVPEWQESDLSQRHAHQIVDIRFYKCQYINVLN